MGDGDGRAFFSVSQSRTLKIIPNPSFPRGADRDFEKKSAQSHAASVWETRAGEVASVRKKDESGAPGPKWGPKQISGKNSFPPSISA